MELGYRLSAEKKSTYRIDNKNVKIVQYEAYGFRELEQLLRMRCEVIYNRFGMTLEHFGNFEKSTKNEQKWPKLNPRPRLKL